ncbi:MAG: AAA family ATPase [Deltaproteobacteria bacterium]|nr:AAA family ATPase [Deltaproteobacteria bacterium]
MQVIGAVGQNGSGKDEVLKYLKARHDVPFFSTGDMVREIAAQEGAEPTRDNLRAISERYFREQGQGCFVRLLAERIRHDAAPVIGISGIRSLKDVQILREVFGDAFVLINVSVSDPRQRYERMVKRAEERDPQQYEQFLMQDGAEEALFHITEAGGQADYTINNDGTLADLHTTIDSLVSDKEILR